MEYLQNTSIQNRLTKAPSYQKKAETFLRRPTPSELGTSLTTFVKDGDNIRQESVNTIDERSVIAQNPGIIGTQDGIDIFNEWVIEEDVVAKNYGSETLQKLTGKFAPFRKSSTIKAIVIDDDVLNDLGVLGDEIHITVSWSDQPMISKKGDFLTSGGYSISSHDMSSTYILTS